ncbi:MAG: DUF1801 domain-containing protein [Bacteroidota bacterium]
MQSTAKTVDEYINGVPAERVEAIKQLRQVILKNLPTGFSEVISYGMVGYVIPHSKYPAGYHCNPELPLPFMSFASQKNFIAFYHMGIYADQKLLEWFTNEYAKQVSGKLDMGKSCIRFKKPGQIPYQLIGELVAKVTPEKWIALYEKNLKR